MICPAEISLKSIVQVKRRSNRSIPPAFSRTLSMNLKMLGLRINNLRILRFMAPMRVQFWRLRLSMNQANIRLSFRALAAALGPETRDPRQFEMKAVSSHRLASDEINLQ